MNLFDLAASGTSPAPAASPSLGWNSPGGFMDKMAGLIVPDWEMKKKLYEKAGLPSPNPGMEVLRNAKVSAWKDGNAMWTGGAGQSQDSSGMQAALLSQLLGESGGGSSSSRSPSVVSPRNPYVETMIKTATPLRLSPAAMSTTDQGFAPSRQTLQSIFGDY